MSVPFNLKHLLVCVASLSSALCLAQHPQNEQPKRAVQASESNALSETIRSKTQRFDIPGKELQEALIDFAVQSQINIVVESKLMEGYRASPVVGMYTIEHALYLLLANTPFDFSENVASNSIQLVKRPELERPPVLDLAEEPPEFEVEEPLMAEEVVVRGIRASLMRAMDLKEQATSILEAITEEDIGKFPDSNLSESLQRVSGVTISYDNNEGNKVRVRGLHPGFNMVTLNGRQMPTADMKEDKAAGTRAFNFADMSADNIAAVEIFKTVEAKRSSGGIGSVINIVTARPFDRQESQTVLNMKLVSDTSNVVGDDITPEFSGIYSHVNDDETFGFLVSGSYQVRDSRAQLAEMFWPKNDVLRNENGVPFEVADEFKDEYGRYWFPKYFDVKEADFHRVRSNGQFVLQWAPRSNVDITLDYTMSQLGVESAISSVSTQFSRQLIRENTLLDENGTLLRTTDLFGTYIMGREQVAFDNKNNSIGFNVSFEANEYWTLSFDAHSSRSRLMPKNEANRFSLTYEAYNAYQKEFSLENSVIPAYHINFINEQDGDGNIISVRDSLYPEDFTRNLKGVSSRFTSDAGVSQVKLDVQWQRDHGLFRAMNTGALVTQQENDSTFMNTFFYDPFRGTTEWIDISEFDLDIFQYKDFSEALSGFDAGVNTYMPAYTFTIDDAISDISGRLADYVSDGYSNQAGVTGSWSEFLKPSRASDKDITLKEDTASVYFELLIANEVWVNFEWLLGVRYEDTQAQSFSNIRVPYDIEWAQSDILVAWVGDEKTASNDEFNYSYLLPSSSIKINITDSIALRVANSKSISRPEMYLIQSDYDFTQFITGPTTQAVSGNVSLLPYESVNSDVAIDWYYGDSSFISVGQFSKELTNYPIKTVQEMPLFGLRNPMDGPRADEASAFLESNGQAVTAANIFAYFHDNYDVDAGTGFFSQAGDAEYIFDVESYTNEDDVSIEGWGFSLQHMFGESGYGFLFNYTHVQTDVDLDLSFDYPEASYPYGGDFMNIVGFYENDSMQIRLAYHWNDQFAELKNTDSYITPIYTEAYGQLDLLFSYNFSNNFSLVLEGLNITNESQRSFSTEQERTVNAGQYGARYSIGARVKF